MDRNQLELSSGNRSGAVRDAISQLSSGNESETGKMEENPNPKQRSIPEVNATFRPTFTRCFSLSGPSGGGGDGGAISERPESA